jgi:hypothetical protein
VNEIKNTPIIILVSSGTVCVAITKAVADLDKKQALLAEKQAREKEAAAAKIELLAEKQEAAAKLLAEKQEAAAKLLAKSIELSEYKGQSEINDTLMRMGYGTEYSEWRQGARKQKAEEGIVATRS